ncbi:centromere/kinetochore protein zw10 homolog [Denticeps clupeoides]|uniref:centromere/kinetochore protein zw10 homolog n=1 Tax=Denticeps clupeoides TaxID=299321 RepID=UPI0010A4ABF0|nr:centromere/kinetochore protein zw10 homolog [Denticeps clupeoides]
MASFVTEVLASSGKLEKEDLAGKISKLSRRVEETKEEVSDMINKKYNEFLPTMQTAEELMDLVDAVSREIDTLKSCIENEVQRNLHEAATEYSKLRQQLEKNTAVIGILQHLKEFDSAMGEYYQALQGKKYIAAAEQYATAQESVAALQTWSCSDTSLLKALRSELTIQRENLSYHLGEEWHKLAVWKLPPSKDLTSAKAFLGTELHLNCGGSKDESGPHPLLPSVLQALAVQGELHKKIKMFGHVLLKYILRPVIMYPSLVVEVGQNEQATVVSLQMQETSALNSTPSQVYNKVCIVLETLHKHLFDVSVGEQKVSLVVGDLIWEDLSDCIIKECLLHSIPSSSCQLDQYSAVIDETEQFEKHLKEMGYLSGEATDLLKYARNVNSHFATKKCQDVIVAARKLMTAEMHSTVKISPDYKLSLPKLPSPGGERERFEGRKACQQEPQLESEQQLGPRTLCLPVCRVSESVQQIVELAVHTLSEAVGSSTTCAVQLFYTVRNIFHLFYDVVPMYHKESFLKFPHLAAIQHNNCMFLAHHLLTLGHQFKPHLPLKDSIAYFVDLVPSFRRLGIQCFVAQMNVQKSEMLERLSNGRNFANLDDDENYSAASKAVRQVIHQLRRLGKVWQDVLPVNVYCKAMGTLLNTAICDITAKILQLEDISSEDGAHLYALCQIILEEGPLVFTPLPEESKNKKYQEEVPVYVKKWMTFKELSIVLQASLQEIVDRWAEGKGPLALVFTSNEMKGLIRALFQNTDRRAVALTKIK